MGNSFSQETLPTQFGQDPGDPTKMNSLMTSYSEGVPIISFIPVPTQSELPKADCSQLTYTTIHNLKAMESPEIVVQNASNNEQMVTSNGYIINTVAAPTSENNNTTSVNKPTFSGASVDCAEKIVVPKRSSKPKTPKNIVGKTTGRKREKKRFPCTFPKCNGTLSSKYNLARHLRNKHGVVPTPNQ